MHSETRDKAYEEAPHVTNLSSRLRDILQAEDSKLLPQHGFIADEYKANNEQHKLKYRHQISRIVTLSLKKKAEVDESLVLNLWACGS